MAFTRGLNGAFQSRGGARAQRLRRCVLNPEVGSLLAASTLTLLSLLSTDAFCKCSHYRLISHLGNPFVPGLPRQIVKEMCQYPNAERRDLMLAQV